MIKSKMKKVVFTLSATLSLTVLAQVNPLTSLAATAETTVETETALRPQDRSQHIDYRYKAVNGRIYRRLFNYYTQQWVGPWELIP